MLVKTAVLVEKLKANLQSKNWQFDRWGNAKKSVQGKDYRIKFQDNSVRVEVKVIYEASQYTPESTGWIRLDGAYFKDLIARNDQVKVGKYAF
jgi:hypothetical protein